MKSVIEKIKASYFSNDRPVCVIYCMCTTHALCGNYNCVVNSKLPKKSKSMNSLKSKSVNLDQEKHVHFENESNFDLANETRDSIKNETEHDYEKNRNENYPILNLDNSSKKININKTENVNDFCVKNEMVSKSLNNKKEINNVSNMAKVAMQEKFNVKDDVDKKKPFESLMYNIAKCIYTRSIRMVDYFADFDMTNKNSITETQFYRVLWQLTQKLYTHETKQLIFTNYGFLSGFERRICYKKFSLDIDSISNIIENKSFKFSTIEKNFNLKDDLNSEIVNKRNDLNHCLKKMALHYNTFEITLRDECKDFDQYNMGTITKWQFSRACLYYNKLSTLEKLLIIDTYEDETKSETVNYMNLHNDLLLFMNISKNNENLLKHKDKKIHQIRKLQEIKVLREEEKNSDNFKVQCEKLFIRLKKISHIYGIRPIEFFKDYDKHGHGKILINKFVSALDMTFSKTYQFQPHDYDNLIEKDGNKREKEKYILPTDYESLKKINNENENEESLIPFDAQDVQKCKYLLKKIRDHMLRYRIRIEEEPLYFDPLRRGMITKQQFKRILSNIGFSTLGKSPIPQKDLDFLANFYQIKKNLFKSGKNELYMVNWNLFKNDVEYIISKPDINKNPTDRISDDIQFYLDNNGNRMGKLKAKDFGTEYSQLFENLCSLMNPTNTMDIKDTFTQFDSHNSGYVTLNNFLRGLKNINFNINSFLIYSAELPTKGELITNETINLEARKPHTVIPGILKDVLKYCTYKGKISYKTFLNDFKTYMETNYPDMINCEPITSKPKIENSSLEKQNVTTNAIKKIRQIVYHKSLRITEWDNDFDPLHHGHISASQFRRILSMQGIELSNNEFDELIKIYKSDKIKETKNKELTYVNIVQFYNDINSAFTQKNLEKSPRFNLKPQTFSDSEIVMNSVENTNFLAIEKTDCVLLKIAKFVKLGQIEISHFFKDYDIVNNGYVTKNQFRRILGVLDIAKFVQNEYEWSLLSEMFTSSHRMGDEINYIQFCKEIEKRIEIQKL
ncbi:hypothetical protein A3Q56_03786 [Intoshia linei]|uniref:EF-hand domain-containing protein n=1 Tax=Intoshia linei TaxID=1819745 RepID=A0A177B2H6_9BILA|nr:hypothetical protein A3Q56_03786 [Intoshia linei]